jgi:hypothetical protein
MSLISQHYATDSAYSYLQLEDCIEGLQTCSHTMDDSAYHPTPELAVPLDIHSLDLSSTYLQQGR